MRLVKNTRHSSKEIVCYQPPVVTCIDLSFAVALRRTGMLAIKSPLESNVEPPQMVLAAIGEITFGCLKDVVDDEGA